MAIIGGIAVGVIEVFGLYFVWKKYEIEICKLDDFLKKLFMGCVVVVVAIFNVFLFQKEYHFTTYLNMTIFHTILLLVAGIDYQKKIIPNKLLLIGMILRTLILMIEFIVYPELIGKELLNSVVGLIFGLLFLLVLCWISKRGIGFGDVKLFAWIGYSVGLGDTYSILFYSALIAAIAGIYLLFVKKESSKKEIPFGPFVWGGSYIVILMSLLS